MLVGRQSELETLFARLDALGEGRSFALVVHGEAGIGKTALLLELAARAREQGVRVLTAKGFESEAELPWAGLHLLARPLLHLLDRLPEVQAHALRAALALDVGGTQDRFTIPVALLGLLGAAAEDGPVLVLVDDAHWLDPSTRDALVFVARRLGAEGVGLVLGARDGEGWDPEDTRVELLGLRGLRREAARELLAETVAPAVADELYAATGGNPLALTEIPPSLSSAERSGREPLPRPLLPGTRVEELFARRIAALPEAARRAAGMAAAMEPPRVDVLAAALEQLGLTAADLAAAEGARILTVDGTSLTFRHPLVRAAAYHAMPPPVRRRVHRALADVTTEPRVRAWHLAGAATGPDATAADALEAAALDARAREAPVEAAASWRRAATLSPDPASAARRTLEGARDALSAGDVRAAVEQLAALEHARALSGALRAEGHRLRGVGLMRMARLEEGIALIAGEADALAPAAPEQAARTVLLTAPGHLGAGDMPSLVAAARRARELAGDVSGVRALADVVEGEALVPLGRAADGAALLEAGAAELVASGEAPVEVTATIASTYVVLERYDDAARLLDQLIGEARAAGSPARLVFPLGVRSLLEQRRGRWQPALADATEAVRLGRETGMDFHLAFALAAVARLEGLLGRIADARRHGHEAIDLVEAAGFSALALHAEAALGLTELGAGKLDAAAMILRAVARRYHALRYANPSVVQWAGNCIEALTAIGALDEAARHLERLADDAERSGSSWARACAERGRGILAGDEAFEAHFARALELHDASPQPFERARTALLLGERRTRAGRADDGRGPLTAALEVFERLGARPWADRARRALAGAGAADGPSVSARATTELTGQDLRIALLVAQGLTNREVGEALFLSPKTIEHYLSAIYRKLGVRSRAQLTRLMADEAGTVGAAAA